MGAQPDPRSAIDEDPRMTRLYDRIAQILAIGFWASVTVIVAGVVLAIARGNDLSNTTLDVADIPSAVRRLDHDGLIDLGILLFLLTPLSYVIAAAFTFLRQRDRLFAGICVLLIVLVLSSVGIALL